MRTLPILAALACTARAQPAPKRAAALDPALQTRLLGRWTNAIDHVIVDIASIDLATGKLAGREAAPGSASDQVHELVGWISDAPNQPGFDHVVPVTFATSLPEYGTLPVWAGWLRGDELVTMHYLVWPTRPYPWAHVTSGQETWTKLPAAGEWDAWSRDRKLGHMQAIVLPDARTELTAYDARRFTTMTCKTCHGDGVDDGSFRMPNPALPQLDGTPDGFQRLEREHPQAVEAMNKLTRRTADLLGEQPFSPQTGSGFGCFRCHVNKAQTARANGGAR
jgi:hypothetical protein